ncbi:monovalent cation/H(+) antiporter subunit G [Pseudokineococcus marinus]|uniref:Cation:proton antiporter n=1 Tax=Pseudokineococcus marinus TaxID=351215 RepID=A0A849BND1_9ACTN|nr:monovalent cation/H(+) antiporter subunit G [Pseudokineococcus marinus]NNH24710.1 cation:proton antiporter [Pseudokineococcus marinus]
MSAAAVVDVVGQGLLLVGSLLVGTAALGLVRLPDVYARTNAATKAAALGLVVVLLGGVVLAPTAGSVLTLLVAIALQLFTVPIGGFEVAQAARLSAAPVTPLTHHDDLGLPREGDQRDEEQRDGEDEGGVQVDGQERGPA